MSAARRAVVGLGNRFRGDDGAGLELAELLRERAPVDTDVIAVEGDPTPLLDIFGAHELVLVADAIATDSRAGTILSFDASEAPVPGAVFGASTHAFGLGETIELARALGSLRGRVLVYGIVGADFSTTAELSPEVRGALEPLAERMLADLSSPSREGGPIHQEESHA